MGQTCSEWIPACFTKILHAGVLQQFSEFTCFRNALSLVCCKRKTLSQQLCTAITQRYARPFKSSGINLTDIWWHQNDVSLRVTIFSPQTLLHQSFIWFIVRSATQRNHTAMNVCFCIQSRVITTDLSYVYFFIHIIFLMLPGQRSLKQRYPKCVAFKL